MKQGAFVISLDFELAWGIRDTISPEKYRDNLIGVHHIIPRLLQLFVSNNIHATFAVVGFLMVKNKKDLIRILPGKKPQYTFDVLSPYTNYIDMLPDKDEGDPLHFAPDLVDLIQKTNGMEIGTHTLSHYYCLEEGQTIDDFREDLKKAIDVAAQKGIAITSLVFPRNQQNHTYFNTCKELGIRIFRGNEKSWLHPGDQLNNLNYLRRACRMLDAYINISGYQTYRRHDLNRDPLINIPSSRFLRPYHPALRSLESLRLRRITRAMTHAARNGELFHLWWHPHNFGIHQGENFKMLEKIIQHFNMLRDRYQMRSLNMLEAAAEISRND